MTTRTFLFFLLAAVLAYPQEILAQIRSTTQQTMFGSRTLGGFPTAGSRTFSGSSQNSSSFGSSSLSGRSLGGTGSSLGGAGLGTSMGGMQMGASERFVRGARQPGQFVGADTQDVSGILSSLGTGAQIRSNQNFNARALSGQGRSRVNQPGQAGQARSGRGTQPGNPLAVVVELGFEPSAAAVPEVVSSRLSSKINQSRRIHTVEPIQVSLADGTAILRGVVATPHDRELAAQWVLLEPGVRAVQNELKVAEKASSEAPAPLLPPP